ncbi:hypothetical protein HDU76_000021 [Blyttiomyces sp. JEL0837]|nr:hypothetical protein HDU76_000021 [Blyttiomyces sp. JEL0837]
MALYLRDHSPYDALDHYWNNQLLTSLHDAANPTSNTTEKNLISTSNNTANQLAARQYWGNTFARLDLTETDTNYILHTDVPGINKDDVNITVKDDVLTISGERKSAYEETDDKKHRHIVERRFGKFSRSVRLPKDVDVEEVNAKMENGVLELTLGKKKGDVNDVRKICVN